MLERLRALIKAGRYRVTLHVEQERDADQILTTEIEGTFTDRESVVLEDYPDDPRGHSVLVLGFTKVMEPLHGVWSIHEKTAILVTIYRPDPRLWTNWRRRKGKST